MTEEEVYQGCKNYLLNNGFKVIAGQPARGVDHLPVIEIKGDNDGSKGSKDAYKPDLVAFKDNYFYIIECKPAFNIGDYDKLKRIKSSKKRLLNFYTELQQYKLFEKHKINLTLDEFYERVKIVLGYSGGINQNYKDINHINVITWMGSATTLFI